MNIDSQGVGRDFAKVEPNSASTVEIKPNVAVVDVEKSKELSSSAEKERDISTVVTPEQIDSAVSQISEFVQASNRQLNFSVDESTQKQIVKVTDTESGEVIRQIPSEEILELSDRLKDLHTDVGTAVGLLFNKQV